LLLSSLLSLAIVLALVAGLFAVTRAGGDALQEIAGPLAVAALVHLCAAVAIEYSRRQH
jgi:hypothetical protein